MQTCTESSLCNLTCLQLYAVSVAGVHCDEHPQLANFAAAGVAQRQQLLSLSSYSARTHAEFLVQVAWHVIMSSYLPQ